MKVTVEFKYRDLTTIELAELYGRSERSMREWLRNNKEKIGKKEGRWWSVKQVIKITELRGPIGAIMKDEEELD
jgi:hypothetical protein